MLKIPIRSRNRLKPLWIGLAAFCATCAVHNYNGAPRGQVTLWLCTLALIAYGLWHAGRIEDRPVRRTALVLACVFSVCTVLGKEITATFGISRLGDIDVLIGLVWAAAGFAVLYNALFKLLLNAVAGQLEWGTCRTRRRFGAGKGGFWLLWAVILLCWTPYYLGLYPGLLSEDSFMQLRQAAGLEALSNYQPVAHTALIAACWHVGKAIGGQTFAIGLYSAVQMGIMAACFAYALRAMARWQAHGAIWWGSLAFFALSPIQGIYGLLMWKDVLHAGFTLLLMVQLFDLALDPERTLRLPRRMIGLGATAFLFCIWRNNGMYAFLLFSPVLVLFALRKARPHWRRVVALVGAVAVCLGVYRGPVFQLAGIEDGPVAEMLSLPSQQIARVVRDHGDQLSQADRDIIAEILPLEELPTLYHPRIADFVKNRLDSEAFSRQPVRYAALWARLLGRYPSTYLASFLCGTYGYWYPDTEQWVITLGEILQGPENVFGLQTQPIAPIFDDVQELVDTQWRDQQGVRLLFSIALMIWIEVIAAAVLLLKRRRALLLPFVLLLIWWCTVLLSPLSAEYRYGYALVLSAPACLAMALAAGSRRGVPSAERKP